MFADYDCSPHPGVFAALAELQGSWPVGMYGSDVLTKCACNEIRKLFDLDQGAGVFFVPSGTAANRLALATFLAHSWEAVICVKGSHINVYEAGATEGLGHKILIVHDNDGKIDVALAKQMLTEISPDIHQVCPVMISISNATELGTAYSVQELERIQNIKTCHDVFLHLDGARFANATVERYPEGFWKYIFAGEGFDSMTMGFAKNGGSMGDVLIIKDPGRAKIAERYHKQFGYLVPRMQFCAAEVLALLKDGIWLNNAANANAMARMLSNKLSEAFGLEPLYLLQTNALFVSLPENIANNIVCQKLGHIWPNSDEEVGRKTVRFMASWTTTEQDIDQLILFLKDN